MPRPRRCQGMWALVKRNPRGLSGASEAFLKKGTNILGSYVRQTVRSAAKSRNELLEPVDRATAAHSGENGIAMNANLAVLNLEVEAAIEIEGWAVLVQLRADASVIEEHEIDLLRSRQHRALERGSGDAFGALLLDPLGFGHERPRSNRHAKDDLVLDDEPGHRLGNDAGLRSEQAKQQRHDAKECPRNHRPPIAMAGTLQQGVECAMNYRLAAPHSPG